jgi:hypothetical protein
MAKQDDRNRVDAVAAVIKLHDRIKELEVELEQLQVRYDFLEEDFIEYKETFG